MNKENVTLTKFKIENAEFVQHNFPYYFKDSSIENIEQAIKNWENTLAFCINYNNKPIGIISLSERSSTELSFGIAIIEEFRGQGLAEIAFEKISHLAKENGFQKIISSCSSQNRASKRMHEKLNFKLIKEEINPAGNKMCRWEKFLN